MGSTVKFTKHFPQWELECKCGRCDYPGMNAYFMQLLEQARVDAGIPFNLSSAYRCPAHNNNVSSTGLNGPHTTGKTVDIQCSAQSSHKILKALFKVGMTGIGVSQKGNHKKRFIHADTLTEGNRPWVWSY